MERHLPPAYEGKPLHRIGIQVVKQCFAHPNRLILQEDLRVSPLDEDDVNLMEENHRHLRNFPPDIFSYYRNITHYLANIALTSHLEMQSTLPQNGVIANYTAHFPDYKYRAGTLNVKATKQIIASAQYFANEARAYIASGNVYLDSESKLRYALENQHDGVIDHDFYIELAPDVPLNGYEGTQFLTDYRNAMVASYKKTIDHIEKMQTLNASQDFIYQCYLQAMDLKLAADRAQALIDGL